MPHTIAMKYFLLILVLLIPVHLLAAASMPAQGDSAELILQLSHRKTKRTYTIELGQKVRIRLKDGRKKVGYIDRMTSDSIKLDNGIEIPFSEVEEIFLPRVKNRWHIALGWLSILTGFALMGAGLYVIQDLPGTFPLFLLLIMTVAGIAGAPAMILIVLGILPFVMKQRRFDLRKKYTFELVPKKP